jgi:nicotinamide phosphoribosyltransferase
MNIILATDSYKLTHWNQYPEGTQGVYSYLEARHGAQYPATVFFGLQPLLQELEANPIEYADMIEASSLAKAHFGSEDVFNHAGWERIRTVHGGRLPVRIKAVPEGSVVPVGNALMTVESTDEQLPWLTNALESFLLHVWYPTTVATRSYFTKQMLKRKLMQSADPESMAALSFMLHDFGYRGATGHESAALGGAGHLVNFLGTDTLPAIQLIHDSYGAAYSDIAYSVPATEHSVMTGLGPAGEMKIVADLIEKHPTGILSVVADSYDIYRFVSTLGTDLRSAVMQRDGKFVVRPDSVTEQHPTPGLLCVNLLDRLWASFGGKFNGKGYKVLDPHVGLLWGDGIEQDGIEDILEDIMAAGYSAENMVFGMGGGLLQKLNRDTQRFAFKCAAQKRNGVWVPVNKGTYGKTSKAGRMKLIWDHTDAEVETVAEDAVPDRRDLLGTVFEDGHVTKTQRFADIRANAEG